jgi:hypothetical protein
MHRYLPLITLLCAAPLSLAETLSAASNRVAYNYAVAMFRAADVRVTPCPAEQRERTGFLYLCGQTGLEGEAFEAAWTPSSRDYGSTDAAGRATAADEWVSVGSGRQGLAVYVEGEFIVAEYGPEGDVSVRSGRTY